MHRLAYLLVFTSLIFAACEKKEEGTKPKYRDITEAVYSTVTVVPKDMYSVFPTVGGILESSNLIEGKEVKKGEVLLKISNQQSQINSKNLKLQYEIAKQNFQGEATLLKDIEESIESANMKLTQDSLSYIRQSRLWAQNIGSLQQYEMKKVAYEVSKNEVETLKNKYRRTESELQRKSEQAMNSYQISMLNSDDFIVTSKMDGLVYELFKEIGEAVNPQTPIAVIGSKDDFVLKLLIDEADISKLYIGQKIILTLDAYADQIFEAAVTIIYPTKDKTSQTFTIEAEFTKSPERLYNGLSGEGNIVVSKKEKVLSLPSQLISSNNMVNTSKGMTGVKTGIKNLQFTEILSGVDTTTNVYTLEQ